jgi:hypothetical protein
MFTPTGSMTTPRYGHIATLLADGKVLIAGGNTVCSFGFAFPTGPSCLYPNRAEVYDPASGTFTATSRMSTANVAGAVLLPNDKVLIAGYDATQTTASVELYDPSTGQFTPAGNPATLTAVYSATLLNDGRVLLAGRVRNSSPVAYGAELYDPASGTFSPVANWPGQPPWSAVGLADATVLIASSHDYDRLPRTCRHRPGGRGDPSHHRLDSRRAGEHSSEMTSTAARPRGRT